MSPPAPAVIVLDGEQRAALAVVRSLGRQGCSVHVGSARYRSLAGGSRFAATETTIPDALDSGRDFGAAVQEMIEAHRARLLIPVTEASTLALLEHGGIPPGVSLPTSDLTTFRRATDKQEVLTVARRLGIDVPAQWVIGSPSDEDPEIPGQRFPLVIKPSRSVAGRAGHRHKTEALHVRTPEELRARRAALGSESGPLLVQERIEGPGIGIFLLRWDGEVQASFAHRRIREKPPAGGVSVRCESIAAPPGLVAQSAALLAAIDWNGAAMIEYKRDVRSGRHYLMEINPRFWGSLQLAVDAGVNFPWLLAQLALGRSIEPVHEWRVGIRSRWRLGEVDHLIARIRRSRAELHLPADAPGLLRTAASTLWPWWPGERSDVFRLSDPRPAFREALSWLRAL